MAPLLHRQPFKGIYLLGFLIVTIIQLPCWLIYYSWRPNRPRKSWTLQRTIAVRILRKTTRIALGLGVLEGRDLSLEVPQEELESLNARFVWIPELEKEDIVGMVAEHAARAGVESIAIPAYWILKEGTKWSPAYDKAQKDEKMMLYFHGGAFVVRVFHFYPIFMPTLCFRWGPPIHLTQQHPSPKERSNIPHLSPEYCRSTTDSVPCLPWHHGTHSRLRL